MAERKKAITQYKGPLTPEQVTAGMNAARRNAARLLEDAKRLFEAGSYPTACSLAILSIEEAGKVSLLRHVATARGGGELKAAWRSYRDHHAKNATWIIGDLALKGARRLLDLMPMYDRDSDHSAVADALKQLGFYTDCCGDRHWSEPFEAVDEATAKGMLLIAQVSSPKHEFSVREVEFWIRHINPRGSPEEMVQGLLDWQAAMEREGLSRHSSEEWRSFVVGDGTTYLDRMRMTKPAT